MTNTPVVRNPSGNLPDFVIIGGMKCGTTSLFKYLSMHPDLAPCKVKEPDYFSRKNWHCGIEWYKSLFPFTDRLKFEASTSYTKYPNFDHVPERMADVIPDVRFIYLVRHPVARVKSELVHNVRAGRLDIERLKQPDFWRTGMRLPIDCSMYYRQLQRYLQFFDGSKICVVALEELTENTAKTLNYLLEFLGLPTDFYRPGSQFRSHNVSSRISPQALWRRLRTPAGLNTLQLSSEMEHRIWMDCAPDLERLEAFIGRPLGYAPPASIAI